MGIFRKVSLAVKPVLHGILELVEGNTGADFHLSIRHRESVVKDAGIGEIAHGERIEPLQWARNGVACVVILDADLAGKHVFDSKRKAGVDGSRTRYRSTRVVGGELGSGEIESRMTRISRPAW